MNFLKSLWPNSSPNVVTIPQHVEGELEDDLDLKVKALTYLFRRIDVESLPSFINDGNGIYSFDCSESSTGNDKLDAIYNKTELERVMVSDEHRILVDWFKNRFRSICILSGIPKSLFESRLAKTFGFVILNAQASDEDYIKTLVESDIYVEHPIDLNTKKQVVIDVLQIQRQLRPSSKQEFNKNDRSVIILKYTRRLSEIVQIERIYKASLIMRLDSYKHNKLGQIKETIDEFSENSSEAEESGVRLFPAVRSSRSRSPVRRYSSEPSRPLSPVKLNTQPQLLPYSPSNSKLTPPSSPIRTSISPPRQMRSRSTSPVKSLKKKQSMTLLKMDKSLTIADDEVHPTTDYDDEWISKDDMVALRSQAEQAVLFRVERERKALRAI